MKCFSPFFMKTSEGVCGFPCGRCFSCRTSQSLVWSLRMQLESVYYSENAFVTLTYAPAHLPENCSLQPSHLQAFFKRLRRKLSYKIRYYACGEYGDTFGRAHYHAIIFGLKQSDFYKVSEAWSYGIVCVEVPSSEAFKYVAGYVTKKIGKVSEWKEKNPNQIPPFQRASLGLGLRFILEQVPAFTNVLQIGDKVRYIGRYLRNKLAEKFGILEQVKLQGLRALSTEFELILSEFYDKGNSVHPSLSFDSLAPYRLSYAWKYEGTFNEILTLAKLRMQKYIKEKNNAKSSSSSRGTYRAGRLINSC